MSGKPTLVIGGGGFVGLNIVEHLLARGDAVRLFDLGAPPEAARAFLADLPGALEVQTGDVCSADAMARAMAGVGDVVFGAAVTAGPERDRTAPERTLDVNLGGFLAALRAAHDAGVRRFVNLSSAGAYGAAGFHGTGPMTEDDPAADPRTVYSITKFASERMADRMGEVWGLDTVSVRLSAVFGRWERRTGVRDTPSPQMQILAAFQDGKPALIDRVDHRDWIYAPDVARAVAALLAAGTLPAPLYNVSSGRRWAVLDWGRALAAHFPGAVCRLAEPGEAATIDLFAPEDRRPLSIDRLVRDTGFAPCFDIDQSVNDYHAWAQKIGPGYR